MTVKELSEFTGKTERAVRNWVIKASEKDSAMKEKSSASTSTHPADYDVDEIEKILNESSLGQNAILIIMENARRKKPMELNSQVDYEIIGKMIGMAVAAAMGPVVKQLENLSVPKLEAPREDYYSLIGYCGLHGIKTNRSELAMHGMALRKMVLESGKELRKIPDERYGKVNSYPVEILDDYFRG